MSIQDQVRAGTLRHDFLGRKVRTPGGCIGVVVETRWQADSSLSLRLNPPGKPAPRFVLTPGVIPDRTQCLTLADIVQVDDGHCWWSPAAECHLVA